MDWVMRPVLRGLCKYESLKDGTLDMADLELMNETLDAEIENRYRAEQAASKGM